MTFFSIVAAGEKRARRPGLVDWYDQELVVELYGFADCLSRRRILPHCELGCQE
jgi:hypothetical protein